MRDDAKQNYAEAVKFILIFIHQMRRFSNVLGVYLRICGITI